MKILATTDRVRGQVDESAFELASAARALAAGDPVAAVVIGAGVADDAARLARHFDHVHVFDDPRLEMPDGDRDAFLLAELAEREGYAGILVPHGNLALDLAPPLAARLERPLATDVIAVEGDGGTLRLRRAVYGGKLHARYAMAAPQGFVLTLRGGAFEAADPGDEGAVRPEAVPAELPARRRPLRTVEPDAGEVDITGADVLVGVGRGIEDEENLELVRDLAAALGGEVACSRPVVDKGWLEKTRQVGTSGVVVKPKVYVAVGISGSFQHVGGIKGSPFVVAVNQDAKAPIFGYADVGVVGDLFEIVPALTEKVRAARS